MKRTLALILAIVMALGLCCGTAFADGPKPESAAPQESAEAVELQESAEAAELQESAGADAPQESAEAVAEMLTEEFADVEEGYVYEDSFADWNEDAPALNTLIEYVEAVTDEESPDYIPVSDRIAVFDMDGTLYGELFPTYLEYYLLAWRILKDPNFEPDAEMLEFGRMLRDHAADKSFPDHMDMLHATHAASAYAGLTLREFAAFVNEILIRDVDGFEGMTYATAFYQPMLEVIDYLQDNDFRVYVCSGSDRAICRTLLEGMIDIPYANIIGMDVVYDATGQGDADGLDYVFKADDDIVRTDKLIIKNLKMNKVRQIVQDIGQQPVLSFGNSGGDVSMHMFTISNNAYRSAAFMLIADDETRDYGNEQKVQSLKKKWEDYGFHVISMKNDFRTIYGDGVVKTGSFRWAEELAEDRVPVEYSPDWVAALPEAQDATQLFIAAGVGETTATVSLHEKDSSGRWRQILTTPGYIGKNGLGKEVEGDGKTPVGTFSFNSAFGLAEDPGCAIPYHQITEDDYWSGDQRKGYHYNELVSIKDLPDLDTETSEHLADFDPAYQYALNLSYNEEGTPGLGSAIFVHCLRPDRPFTGGCVAIPAEQMLALMQHVRPDCVAVIDSLEALSPETWADWGLGMSAQEKDNAAAEETAEQEESAAAEETAVQEESAVEETSSLLNVVTEATAVSGKEKEEPALSAAEEQSAAPEPVIDYGSSALFTVEEMDEAIALIREEFDKWEGCELHSIRFAGDRCARGKNVRWLNKLDDEHEITQCIEFLSDFHSPREGGGAWEPDEEYANWQWWLGRTDAGAWELITWGY